MPRDDGLAKVRERIDRFERTGDPDVVLAFDAILELAELGRVRRAGPRGAPDLPVCHAAGWLFWYRYVELAKRHDERTEGNRVSALAYLASVYPHDPMAVPQTAERLLVAEGVRSRAARTRVGRTLRRAAEELQRAVLADDHARRDRVITTLWRVGDRTRADPADRAYARFFLGLALMGRYADGGTERDLHDGIASLRHAQADPHLRRRAAPDLGYLSYLRFKRTGDRGDLELAIPLLRAGTLALPPDEPLFDVRQAQLAEALHGRYRLTADLGELNEAIAARRLAARFSPDPGTLVQNLAELSLLLRLRYGATDDTDSLDEAVAVGRRALDAGGQGVSRWPGLAALAGALVVRFQRAGVLTDLTEANSRYRTMLDDLPERHPHRPDALADLAATLIERHRLEARYGGRTDTHTPALDEAIDLLRRALAGRPEGGDGRIRTLLAAALNERYERTGDPALPDQIVDVTRRAVDAASGTADARTAWNAHGISLYHRYLASGDPGDLRAAVTAARAAATADAVTPTARFEAATWWARYAARAGAWDEAVDGYRYLVNLLPRLAPAYLHRGDQERRLAGAVGLVCEAAAAAVQADQTDTAVELLEYGRAILHSVALDSDVETDDLRRAAPELAEEFRDLRVALNSAADAAVTAARRLPPDADRRYRLTRQWDDLLARIRTLPGFARFLMPPRIPDLLPAAADGHIVIVNASQYRCDALVLDRARVRLVPLPNLNLDELSARAERFNAALRAATDPAAGLLGRMTAGDAVRETLAWLWDTVTGPVLDAIGLTAAPTDAQPWPRIWWSPTGPLTFLPLHAAGHHADGGPAVLDRVVSSYTPTMRALAHARGRARAASSGPLLLVAMPRTPGHADLNATLTEGMRIADARASLRRLIGPLATRENVLDALSRCGWAHFACHAHSDPARPSTNHLILHDQPLMVTDLNRLRLPVAELAYLSACSTARTTAALAGEAIHLGSAFQIAGFPHVIATGWEVGDGTAAGIAESFYRYVVRAAPPTPAAIATALHLAIRDARGAYPLLPTEWAAHVHIGP